MYVSDLVASVYMPNFQLANMKRSTLEPGEAKDVVFAFTPAVLEMLNNKAIGL